MLHWAFRAAMITLLLIGSTQRNASASLAQAIDLFTAQHYTESQLQLERFITEHPDDPTAHYYLGQVYLQLAEYDKAIQHCKQAVDSDVAQAKYRLCLARGYGEKARRAPPWHQAILAFKVRRELEQAVALDPTHVQARIGLTKFYMQAPRIMGGGLDKAQTQAQHLLPLAPDKANALLQKITAQRGGVTPPPTPPSFTGAADKAQHRQ